jgi:hypothetical protein
VSLAPLRRLFARLFAKLAGFGRPFAVARLGWVLARLTLPAALARLDPVLLPVGRLLGYRVHRRSARARLAYRILRALPRGLVRTRVVAAGSGLTLSSRRRLPAVRAVRPTLSRLVVARPVVAAAASASTPPTTAALSLPLLALLLWIVGARLSASLAVGLRVALALTLRVLLTVVTSALLRRTIAALAGLAHWPLAAAVALRALAAVAAAPAALTPMLAMRTRLPVTVSVSVAPTRVIARHASARARVALGDGRRRFRGRGRRR